MCLIMFFPSPVADLSSYKTVKTGEKVKHQRNPHAILHDSKLLLGNLVLKKKKMHKSKGMQITSAAFELKTW